MFSPQALPVLIYEMSKDKDAQKSISLNVRAVQLSSIVLFTSSLPACTAAGENLLLKMMNRKPQIREDALCRSLRELIKT